MTFYEITILNHYHNEIIYAKTIKDVVTNINECIQRNRITCSPLSHNIVTNWTSRKNGKKSKKYEFVNIIKKSGRMFKEESVNKELCGKRVYSSSSLS